MEDNLTEETTQTIVEVVVPDRPFLTTSFEDYSVTEGLLLVLVVLVFIQTCVKIVKEGFHWL